jgi:hypothetical protein
MSPNYSSPATLIFPALNHAAQDYFNLARLRGERVVAAASEYEDAIASVFGELILLPYVYDAAFAQQFLELIGSRSIHQVYAPVASVYTFLETFIDDQKLPIRLIGASPIRQQVEAYRNLRGKAEDAQAFVEQCAGTPSSTLSLFDIAAIMRQASNIYGESNDQKIAAMMAIFASAPKGDVVEIGSLMGRSAFVLQYLARHYDVGPVLSVDPLSAETAVQADSPEVVRSSMVNQWDYDVLREAFVVNLLPTAAGRFNYLRMESEHGFEVYRARRTIATPHFGEVAYRGNIAVIHIDGNHDFRQVKKDCELWLTLLVPGAWLILDDYLWSHGDGPYRVGNTLLDERKDDIDRSFVCGKALFVKFKRADQ